jgi:hypothetical protein
MREIRRENREERREMRKHRKRKERPGKKETRKKKERRKRSPAITTNVTAGAAKPSRADPRVHKAAPLPAPSVPSLSPDHEAPLSVTAAVHYGPEPASPLPRHHQRA